MFFLGSLGFALLKRRDCYACGLAILATSSADNCFERCKYSLLMFVHFGQNDCQPRFCL
uniref:Uncharacterized protein n=1 Tax=Tetraselmis sp. GSL018 TaxID=582737 RepID=A0A061QQT9_9CHLO